MASPRAFASISPSHNTARQIKMHATEGTPLLMNIPPLERCFIAARDNPAFPKNICTRVLYQVIKHSSGLALGTFSVFLYDQEGRRFAKRYLGAEPVTQEFFSLSGDYAQFFFTYYTTVELFDFMLNSFNQPRAKSSFNLKNFCNKSAYFLFIAALSMLTSIPSVVPIKDKLQMLLSLLASSLTSAYAFHISYLDYQQKHDKSPEALRQQQFKAALRAKKIELINNSSTEIQLQNWEFTAFLNSLPASHETETKEKHKKLKLANQVLGVLAVLVPYSLFMAKSFYERRANLGPMKEILSDHNDLRMFETIAITMACNLPAAILASSFCRQLIDSYREMFFETSSIEKKYYPKLYLVTMLSQFLMVSVSWSTAVELFLDFCGGPQFTHASNLAKGLLYFSSSLIALGLFQFNFLPTFELANKVLIAMIGKFSRNSTIKTLVANVSIIDRYTKRVKPSDFSDEALGERRSLGIFALPKADKEEDKAELSLPVAEGNIQDVTTRRSFCIC